MARKVIVPPELLGISGEFSLFLETVKVFGLEREFLGETPLPPDWGEEEYRELQRLVIVNFSDNPILELPFPENGAPETELD